MTKKKYNKHPKTLVVAIIITLLVLALIVWSSTSKLDEKEEEKQLCAEVDGTWHDGINSCLPCFQGQTCTTECKAGCDAT
jgi:hypothetical protein